MSHEYFISGAVFGILLVFVVIIGMNFINFGEATAHIVSNEDFELLQETKASQGYLEDKKVYWSEYNLGGDPFISCDSILSTNYGVWLCKTSSVAGFQTASIDIRPIFSDLNHTALSCLGIDSSVRGEK